MKCSLNQTFGGNANPSYKGIGLKGHSGTDVDCQWEKSIHTPVAALTYKVLTKERPSNDGSGFTGVFLLVEDGIETYELLIGHINPVVVPGAVLKATDHVGYQANNGTVYANGIQITLEMQRRGDQRGTHTHWQKRPYKKVLKRDPSKSYLTSQSDMNWGSPFYQDKDGYFYEIWNYDNGYNGCVDLFKPIFQRDLFVGRSGYDVACLQRFLHVEATGYFGMFTMVTLRAWQKSQGLPVTGYFGAMSRAKIPAKIFTMADLTLDVQFLKCLQS